MLIDKVQLIESIIEHLTQNEDSFINACENFLGTEVIMHPKDNDLCIVPDDTHEPAYETINGTLCYA